MQSLIVEKKYNEKKLNIFLFEHFTNLSSSTFYKALRKKDIRVNNIRVTENVNIHTGDEIKVFITDNLLFKTFSPDIVYEDNNILIVNKPAELEVVGDDSLTSNLKISLYSTTENAYLEPCHRLDRNTTGLVLFAKNEESKQIILEKFKNQEIEKHYLAYVYGIPKNKKETLNAFLFKDNKKSIVYISDEPHKGYVPITTSYLVLETDKFQKISLLDVTLHTGKTHQIRAHLAHIGYPILGDGKYGINQVNKQFKFKYQQLQSYILKFNFSTNSGILDYLNGKCIKLNNHI